MLEVSNELEALDAPPLSWPPVRAPDPAAGVDDLAAPLALALGRAGWDVEGVEARLWDHRPRGGGRRRRFSSVAADVPGVGRVEVGFGGVDGEGIASVASGGRTVRWHEGRRGGPPTLGLIGPEPDGGAGGRQASETRALAWARSVVAALVAHLEGLRPGSAESREEVEAGLVSLRRRPAMPAPEGMPVLYAWVDRSDLHGVAPGDGSDFVLRPGRRLASGAGPAGWRPYVYACDDPGRIAGHVVHGPSEEALPMEVRLRSLDGVYVVDDEAYERTRAATFARAAAEDPPRRRMTDRELDACVAAVVPTLTPYADYVPGTFATPTVVIGRELGPDEARFVRGRVEARVEEVDGRPTIAVDVVAEDGRRLVVQRPGTYGPRSVRLFEFHLGHFAERVLGGAPRVARELRELRGAR